jgi:hypothetical protein
MELDNRLCAVRQRHRMITRTLASANGTAASPSRHGSSRGSSSTLFSAFLDWGGTMRTRRREKSGLASYKATRDSNTGTSRSHALFRSRTSCSELMMSEPSAGSKAPREGAVSAAGSCRLCSKAIKESAP